VIGTPVEDVRGGEPVSGKLTPEVTAGHFGPPGICGDSNSQARDRSIASLKDE
jgi:hypothetical protein